MDTIISRVRERANGEKLTRATVVAVHEDFATGARVSEFCRSLARELGDSCELIKQMWLVNLLRLPQLRAIAAEDAASAAVIVVSFHDAERFPAELKDWVELWLQHKGDRPIVLLALFDEVSRQPTSLQAYLEAAAKSGGLDFFLQTFETAVSHA